MFDVYALPEAVHIGHGGPMAENKARPIRFDFSRFVALYGPGELELRYQAPGSDELQRPVLVVENTIALWLPTAEELAEVGTGAAQFAYITEKARALSQIFAVIVDP